MDNTSWNKRCAKVAHRILKETEPEIKLGHVYDILARACGQPSWNHAAHYGTDLRPGFRKIFGFALTEFEKDNK